MTKIPELVILKSFLIYINYNKYISYINIDKAFKELYILYQTLKHLHKQFPDTNKTVDELEATVSVLYPAMPSSEAAAIGDLCATLRSVEVSDAVVGELLTSIKKRETARKLALDSLNFSEGRLEESELLRSWSEFEDAKGVEALLSTSRNFVTDDLYSLRDHTIRSGGLYWPLTTLNLSLGPLRKGDFGFVFARPETGKTTFLAHACTHMATQAEAPILWFNNEEQGEKVRVRTYQACLGFTTDELFRDIERNQLEYRRLTGERVRIYDDASIHRRDVEALVTEMAPALVIFDQIDKIKGFDADRPDLVFGRIYQWARELAKTYCPIIGTCQSDGSGEGVKWLTMSHVAEAKTSKQAEADWILGIGRSNEAGTESVRHFNISKNKLMGDEKTDPELRHGRFDVFIRPQQARYEDILDG